MTRDPGDSSDSAPSYAELEREKERFRKLSDAAFEGLAIHDNGIIVDCNQALAKMFGYEISELIGESVVPLGAPETRDLVRAKFESDNREPYEAMGLRKDGTKFAAEI